MVIEGEAELVHVLLVCFPGQGHINPFLRLAKRLASKGLLVTFSTTEEAGERMNKARGGDGKPASSTPIGKGRLGFEFFSDSCELDDPIEDELKGMMERFKKVGPSAVGELIDRLAAEGKPVDCIINNPFLPWVLDVAVSAGVPSGLFWVQSCAVFSTYYHYCNDPAVEYPATAESGVRVRLPGMPELGPDEVPSFLLETNPYMCLTEVILDQIKKLSKATWVIVDSFEELERPVLESLEGMKGPLTPPKLLPIGPLVKSVQQMESSGGSTLKADLRKAADHCMEWLDSRPSASVVYISLGSVAEVTKEEMEEMAWGVRNSGWAFLWVVRDGGLQDGFLEETAGRGLVVEWSPQEKVLSHPSVACFLTHCGWNSTVESLCSGVPVVGFPQWGDQVTNAKFLADVYGVGLRLKREARKGFPPMVWREEVERCIAEVMDGGPRAEEMKKNALRWKEAAAAAVAEGSAGGSSEQNLQGFVDDIKKGAAKRRPSSEIHSH